MKIVNKLFCIAAMVSMLSLTANLQAQDNSAAAAECNATAGCATASCSNCGGGVPGSCVPVGNCGTRPGCSCPTACNGVGPEGYCIGCGNHASGAFQDHYSPQRIYAYSPDGLNATRMHHWNWRQSSAHSWHGNYNYWLYGQPTALVVPPTAAFQSEYNWGVAQTRSLPIYHQYNRNFIGIEDGDVATGNANSNTPYWPYSTYQFGIYPVRGPW